MYDDLMKWMSGTVVYKEVNRKEEQEGGRAKLWLNCCRPPV